MTIEVNHSRPDQSELADLMSMIDALAASRSASSAALDDERPNEVDDLAHELVGLGLWTLGNEVSAGGGGADARTTALVLERLGRYWPALAWAAVQAHAAVDVLEEKSSLRDQVHQRAVGVAVVDAGSAGVRLSWRADRLVGEVLRVDAAHAHPCLVVLEEEEALIVPAEGIVTSRPLARTGLGGAMTRALTVDVPIGAVTRLAGSGRARRRLLHGAAAIGVGIASVAAEEAVGYAVQRRQFGASLTAIAGVRSSLLDQVGRSAALRLALGETADEATAVTLARSATTLAVEVCAAALQSHGGYGYLTEFPVERHLRDAVSLRAASALEDAATAAGRLVVGQALARAIQEEES